MGELGDYYHNASTFDGQPRRHRRARGGGGQPAPRPPPRRAANGWHQRHHQHDAGLAPSLYDHTGRRAEWKRLVEEIVPDFVDPATDGPLPGREEEWSLVTEYRVLLAEEARDWSEAERLQRVSVDWVRRRAAPFLDQPGKALDSAARNAVRSLAASLHELARDPARARRGGVRHALPGVVGDRRTHRRPAGAAAVTASTWGTRTWCDNVPALRDLDQAETWYRRSLDLCDQADSLGRAKCLKPVGLAWPERFKEARAADCPE